MRPQQGVDEAQDIRTERQAEEGGTAAQQSAFGTILEGQSLVTRKNSSGAEVVQPRMNLIEGPNITITLADDPVNSEADITLGVVASPSVTSVLVAGTKVVGARETGWTAGTGVANKGAFATYAGQTVSAGYVQAEAQATDDATKGNSQRIKALEDAMRTHGLIN